MATPIGNLDDLSPRALDVLRSADVIACEDTRHTGKLLARYGIDAERISCHKFNERERIAPVLERLVAGASVALVSDGGTPGICDPGSRLVEAAARIGVRVEPIPGAFAGAALLSASGFPADRFVFEGFLPHRAAERRRRLRALAEETRAVVFYESPHRIQGTLRDVAAIFGTRALVVGRELTKRFETIERGPAAAVAERLAADAPRGEYALVLGPVAVGEEPVSATDDAARRERLRAAWSASLEAADGDRRRALKEVTRRLGLKRSEAYRALVEIGIEP